MCRLSTLCVMLGLLFFAPLESKAAVILDFESFAHLTVLDDQLNPFGADFNGSARVFDDDNYNSFGFPPQSGERVIINGESGTGPIIRADAVGGLWSSVGGWTASSTTITLTAYDSGGSVLGSDSGGPTNTGGNGGAPELPNIFLSVSAPNIAYAEFSDGGSTFIVDDFTFEQQPPIPEPTSLIVWSLLGAFALTLGRRRRTGCASP